MRVGTRHVARRAVLYTTDTMIMADVQGGRSLVCQDKNHVKTQATTEKLTCKPVPAGSPGQEGQPCLSGHGPMRVVQVWALSRPLWSSHVGGDLPGQLQMPYTPRDTWLGVVLLLEKGRALNGTSSLGFLKSRQSEHFWGLQSSIAWLSRKHSTRWWQGEDSGRGHAARKGS